MRCDRRATRGSAISARWPASPPRRRKTVPPSSASTRCTRCFRMTGTASAPTSRQTGAFWTRSISTSPASRTGPACPLRQGRSITAPSGTPNAPCCAPPSNRVAASRFPPRFSASPRSRQLPRRCKHLGLDAMARRNCAIPTIPAWRPSPPGIGTPSNFTPSCNGWRTSNAGRGRRVGRYRGWHCRWASTVTWQSGPRRMGRKPGRRRTR